MSKKIAFYIQSLQEDAITPIANAEIHLENINLGQKLITDSNDMAYFEIDEDEKLKSFRARLIHKDYQEIPISDRSIIPNALQNRVQQLRFNKKLYLFFDGRCLKIMKGGDRLMQIQTFSGIISNVKNKQELIHSNKIDIFASNIYTAPKDFYSKNLESSGNTETSNNKKDVKSTFANARHYDNEVLQKGHFAERDFVLENGEYYINPNILDKFHNECECFNSHHIHISQDAESAINDTRNNANKKDSKNTHIPNLTFYKDKECKERYAQIIISDNHIETPENNQESIIIKTHQAVSLANMLNRQTKQINQTDIKMQIQNTQNQVEEVVIYGYDSNLEDKKVIANINKPFAPDTYIELEARGGNLEVEQAIYWKQS